MNSGSVPRPYDTPGSTYIQWKGTNVCMDVVCICGQSFHIDADFAYAARCPHCHRVLRFGTEVSVTEADPAYEGVVVEAERST